MARFHVLVVGKSRCAWAQSAVDDYTKRLSRYGGVVEVAVKPERFDGDVDAVRIAEGERLLAAAGSKALVALDERGDDLDSDAFTALVDRQQQRGPVAFALGGAYGLSPEVREGAVRVVRLSALVLNHEIARVVLYEQLYRAMTRIRGEPYHH